MKPKPCAYAPIIPSPASFEAAYSEVWTGKRRVLRRREHLRLAVHRAGRGERDPFDTRRARIASSTFGGRDRVLLEVPARVLEAVAHVGVGLEVKDPVAAAERAFEQRLVEDVALDELDAGVAQQVRR